MNSERECFVYIVLPGATEFVTAGRFRWTVDSVGGVAEFVYGRSYRERADAVELDPGELRLSSLLRSGGHPHPDNPPLFTRSHLSRQRHVGLERRPVRKGRRRAMETPGTEPRRGLHRHQLRDERGSGRHAVHHLLQPGLRPRRHRISFRGVRRQGIHAGQTQQPVSLVLRDAVRPVPESRGLPKRPRRPCTRQGDSPQKHEFKEDEILGALDSFRETTEVELVQIVKGVNWRGVRFNNRTPPEPHGFPVQRGTYLPIDTNEALLWTQGSVLDVHMENRNFNVYKEAVLAPIPSPVLLRRFSGQWGWHETCASVLGLTKMDWNNNTLYNDFRFFM